MMSRGRGQGGSQICFAVFNNSMSELRYIINIDSMLISSILFSAMNAVMMFMTLDIFCNAMQNAMFITQGL